MIYLFKLLGVSSDFWFFQTLSITPDFWFIYPMRVNSYIRYLIYLHFESQFRYHILVYPNVETLEFFYSSTILESLKISDLSKLWGISSDLYFIHTYRVNSEWWFIYPLRVTSDFRLQILILSTLLELLQI